MAIFTRGGKGGYRRKQTERLADEASPFRHSEKSDAIDFTPLNTLDFNPLSNTTTSNYVDPWEDNPWDTGNKSLISKMPPKTSFVASLAHKSRRFMRKSGEDTDSTSHSTDSSPDPPKKTEDTNTLSLESNDDINNALPKKHAKRSRLSFQHSQDISNPLHTICTESSSLSFRNRISSTDKEIKGPVLIEAESIAKVWGHLINPITNMKDTIESTNDSADVLSCFRSDERKPPFATDIHSINAAKLDQLYSEDDNKIPPLHDTHSSSYEEFKLNVEHTQGSTSNENLCSKSSNASIEAADETSLNATQEVQPILQEMQSCIDLADKFIHDNEHTQGGNVTISESSSFFGIKEYVFNTCDKVVGGMEELMLRATRDCDVVTHSLVGKEEEWMWGDQKGLGLISEVALSNILKSK